MLFIPEPEPVVLVGVELAEAVLTGVDLGVDAVAVEVFLLLLLFDVDVAEGIFDVWLTLFLSADEEVADETAVEFNRLSVVVAAVAEAAAEAVLDAVPETVPEAATEAVPVAAAEDVPEAVAEEVPVAKAVLLSEGEFGRMLFVVSASEDASSVDFVLSADAVFFNNVSGTT